MSRSMRKLRCSGLDTSAAIGLRSTPALDANGVKTVDGLA